MRRIIYICLMIIMLWMCLYQACIAESFDYVLKDGHKSPIPRTYEVKQVISKLGENTGILNQAEDLFIDKKDNIYITDTGNNRVVRLNPDGSLSAVFTSAKDIPFKAPTGVYVDNEGGIFVADTKNNRIVHLSTTGEFVEEFIKPQSELLGNDFTFLPNKVYVNPTGLIFVLKGQSFISMDANNQFSGFVGSTEVGFDFQRMLVRMFASKEQKAKLAKPLPVSYSNFVVDDDGMIYAVTMNSTTDQIRKINSVGKNIYKKGFYGETIRGENKVDLPIFADIAVDKDGIITVLEQTGGKCYQYDQDGNLLTVFGGKGEWKGVFNLPTSIAVNSKGNIYVLDRKLNNVQVFVPTRFAGIIKKAVTSYNNGEYANSLEQWKQVLKTDSNYSLAHKGMGMVYIKEEKFKEAMNEFLTIDDKTGYSEAFGLYMHDSFRKNFAIFVGIMLLIIFAIVFIFSKMKKFADKQWMKGDLV